VEQPLGFALGFLEFARNDGESSTIASRFAVRILGADCQRDSAARGELCGDDCLARRTGFHEIVQYAVCDRFVERALVPVRSEIKFQGLAFDAEAVGHVIDVDPGEIGLARDWTNGSEIVGFKMNLIIALRSWIWKSLESRLSG
jgi:hypothetical protein